MKHSASVSTTQLILLEFAPAIAGLVGFAVLALGSWWDYQLVASIGVLIMLMFLFAGVGWVFAERFAIGCGVGLIRAFLMLALMVALWGAADSEDGVSGLVLVIALAVIGFGSTVVSTAVLWASLLRSAATKG